MTIELRAYLSNPKNLTVVSLLVLVVILAVEVLSVNEVGTRLPAQIDSKN